MSVTKIVRTLRPMAEFMADSGRPPVISASVQPAPERASLLTKAGRLRRELRVWLQHGAQIAPKVVRKARLEQCEACSYYQASGNAGLGACTYPGCGCTRAKTFLATSRCPQTPPRWDAFTVPSGPH